MALQWSDLTGFDRGSPGGWKESAKTPAGKYELDYMETIKLNPYLLQFGCTKIDAFKTENEARQAAQEHINELVQKC